jgi:hypothetical protein
MESQASQASLPLLASAGQGKRRRYSFDPGLDSFEKIRGKKITYYFVGCFRLYWPSPKNNKLFFFLKSQLPSP